MMTTVKGFLLSILVGLAALSQPAGAQFLKTFEGWKVYTSSCILCHGPQGRGDGYLAHQLELDAADFHDRRRKLSDMSDRELVNEIKGASAHLEGMPQWRNVYSDPQLSAVVAYVRYLSWSRHPLLDDPAEGKEYYERYCVSCHGPRGKGDGFMAELLDIDIADHSDSTAMNKLTNAEMVSIICGDGQVT